mmetsp:Transcript_17944/g.26557  ORF Transcript_17944/g.26557 Transcript_17944/m.26557 type:complete len:84 (+) Transcript_17944:325-576(+)
MFDPISICINLSILASYGFIVAQTKYESGMEKSLRDRVVEERTCKIYEPVPGIPLSPVSTFSPPLATIMESDDEESECESFKL